MFFIRILNLLHDSLCIMDHACLAYLISFFKLKKLQFLHLIFGISLKSKSESSRSNWNLFLSGTKSKEVGGCLAVPPKNVIQWEICCWKIAYNNYWKYEHISHEPAALGGRKIGYWFPKRGNHNIHELIFLNYLTEHCLVMICLDLLNDK